MPTRRLVMLTPAALAIAGVGRARADAPAPFRPHGDMASLFISRSRVLVMVRSRGGAPVPMVFDTGTSGNALDSPYAMALGLQKTGETNIIDGSTGRVLADAFETILPQTSLGGINCGDQPFGVYPRPETNEAGIVGPNIFDGRLVYLELAQERFRVRDKAPWVMPSGPSYPYLDDLPGISIEAGGLKALAMMDSGHTGGLALPLEMAASLSLEAAPVVVGEARSVSGTQPIYGARLRGEMKVGPLTLTQPDLRFFGVHPNVGFDIMRQMTVIMDPAERRSWAVVPSRTAAGPLSDYVGIYGSRRITLVNDALVYEREGRAPRPMVPFDGDLFEVRAPDEQIQFVRDGTRVVGFDHLAITSTPVDRTA